MRSAETPHQDPGFKYRQHGSKKNASFQIIVLGSSGGPREDTITGLLVRAPQTEWRKGSMIAVDAGAHLASIIRVLEQEMPMNSAKTPPKDYSKVLETGPFAGVRFPYISAKANALFLFRELLHSVLITHPHLDHLSGIAINTPALEYGREAKAIVALPSTIEAIKNHIFNDAIWPNLSDEGHGVGFITYRRLIEGGNPRLGIGEARGYVNVCDGLATKCWSVSHGKCHRRSHNVSHQRGDSFGFQNDGYNFPTRRLSRISDDYGYMSSVNQQYTQNAGAYHPGQQTPGIPQSAVDKDHLFEPVSSSAFFIRNDANGNEILIFGDTEPDTVSMSPRNHVVWDDAAPKIAKGLLKAIFIECSFDDSVRNEDLYGHLCPRHLVGELTYLAKRVMALKVQRESEVDGEAQYQRYNRLSGQEMQMQQPPTPLELKKKRKRGMNGDLSATPEITPISISDVGSPTALATKIPGPAHYPDSPARARRKTETGAVLVPDGDSLDARLDQRSITPQPPPRPQSRPLSHTPGPRPTTSSSMGMEMPEAGVMAAAIPGYLHSHQGGSQQKEKLPEPLKGLAVHIIHVKDTLMDGASQGDVIGGQLRKRGEETGLGCEFDITSCGESIWI